MNNKITTFFMFDGKAFITGKTLALVYIAMYRVVRDLLCAFGC